MAGLEVGLSPFTALQSIAVIGGNPSVWGDGALALVEASMLLEWIKEEFDEAAKIATCSVKRFGKPEATVRTFSFDDAQKANLLNKEGPWRGYPKRMCQMRARAFALRDTFADVLKGAAPGHVEGCVLQLAAAINRLPGHTAQFKARSVKEAAASPVYRASVEQLAAMFRFCIEPPAPKGRAWSEKERKMVIATRENLLRYLRAAVATWARPDAIFDLKAQGQWHPAAGVLDLNPPGRRQTKKYRPTIPVARQFTAWLDEAMTRDSYLPVSTVRHGWASMRQALGLPGGREAGEKLIRRSMATICRKLIGEANWTQGEMMLGHRKASISDIYALPDPANLGLALAATESVIDQIERLTPGAFCRRFTAEASPLRIVEGGR